MRVIERARPGNVLLAGCPSRQALDLVADKWTMLTQTLRSLERDGLVERTVHPVVPPMVEYRLTPLGATLIEPLSAVSAWAERHMHEVVAAREQAGTPGSSVSVG